VHPVFHSRTWSLNLIGRGPFRTDFALGSSRASPRPGVSTGLFCIPNHLRRPRVLHRDRPPARGAIRIWLPDLCRRHRPSAVLLDAEASLTGRPPPPVEPEYQATAHLDPEVRSGARLPTPAQVLGERRRRSFHPPDLPRSACLQVHLQAYSVPCRGRHGRGLPGSVLLVTPSDGSELQPPDNLILTLVGFRQATSAPADHSWVMRIGPDRIYDQATFRCPPHSRSQHWLRLSCCLPD
jgi:hypothetical protein